MSSRPGILAARARARGAAPETRAPSSSSRALRFCDDKCAARAGELLEMLETRRKKI
jgi:hypothetical protein